MMGDDDKDVNCNVVKGRGKYVLQAKDIRALHSKGSEEIMWKESIGQQTATIRNL